MDVADRPVRGVDNRQRRGIGLDEQQRRLGIVSFVADRLSQCGRGQKGRDQHHILDLVGNQRITQHRGLDGICPGDSSRRQLVAARGCALAGPQDRRDHLVGWADCRILLRGNVELVFIDGGTIAILTFDQHHPDRSRRHRHTKYGFHSSPPWSCPGRRKSPHVFPLPPEFTRILALGIGRDGGLPEPICRLLRDGYRRPKPPWPPPKPPNPWPPPKPPNPCPPPKPPNPWPPPKGPWPPPNDPRPCPPPKRPPAEGPPWSMPSLGSDSRIPGGTTGMRGTGTSTGGTTGTGAAGSGAMAGGFNGWGAATGVGISSLGFGTDA